MEKKYYISTGMYERYKQLSISGPKEIKKIEEFKEYLENNYIYEVAVFDPYITGQHVFSYQRTEFSKKKYLEHYIIAIIKSKLLIQKTLTQKLI